MEVAAAPLAHGFPTALDQPIVAVSFPVAATVRVAVQGQDEGAHWVLHVLPSRGLALSRETHPRFGVTAQFGLDIGLFRVGLLHGLDVFALEHDEQLIVRLLVILLHGGLKVEGMHAAADRAIAARRIEACRHGGLRLGSGVHPRPDLSPINILRCLTIER